MISPLYSRTLFQLTALKFNSIGIVEGGKYFSDSAVVRTWLFHCPGSNPGQGTEITLAAW